MTIITALYITYLLGIDSLKSESRHYVNFGITDDTGSCHNDTPWYQWRKKLSSWQLSVFSVYTIVIDVCHRGHLYPTVFRRTICSHTRPQPYPRSYRCTWRHLYHPRIGWRWGRGGWARSTHVTSYPESWCAAASARWHVVLGSGDHWVGSNSDQHTRRPERTGKMDVNRKWQLMGGWHGAIQYPVSGQGGHVALVVITTIMEVT